MRGEVVHSFDAAVPITDAKLSTRELITMLFGPAPVPNPVDQMTPLRRFWWRLWKS